MKERIQKSKSHILLTVVICLVIFSCAIFWRDFMRGSDFAWTVQQPEYWNAVIKMLFVFWGYYMLLLLPLKNGILRWSLVGAFYLILSYQHAFFYAALVSLVYAIFIYLTGYLINKIFAKGRDTALGECHFSFALGMAGVICFVGIASVLRQGTPSKLRIIFLVLLVLEIVLARKHILQIAKKLVFHSTDDEIVGKSRSNMLMLVLILTMVTLATCRSGISIDYDSLWYGYQSHEVLAPETGIYDKVTLLACVHTYSKGIEALTLPFAGLSTFSFIQGVNVMLGAMTLWAAYELGKETLSPKGGLFMATLIALTPSIMNMTVTAKSDTASLYLQVVAFLFLTKALKRREGKYIFATIAVLILTFVFKPTAIIFSTPIAIVLIIAAIILKIKVRWKDLLLCIAPCLAVVFLWTRTAILTGYPLTSLISSFLKAIGYDPLYPYTLSSSGTNSVKDLFSGLLWERIARIPKLLFAPNTGDIVTTEINWWGPMATVLVLVIFVSLLLKPVQTVRRAKADSCYAVVLILFLVMAAMSAGTMLLLTRPDGNYYMVFLACAYWFAIYHWGIPRETEKHLNVCMIVPLIVCNFLLCIAISPSWCLGLTPVDMENRGYYNHEEKYMQNILQYHGLSEINAYLKENPTTKLIAFSNKSECVFSLSCASEHISELVNWGSNTLKSPDAFYDYMVFSQTQRLLVDDSYLLQNDWAIEYLTELANQGSIHMEYASNGYALLTVSARTLSDIPSSSQAVLDYLQNVMLSVQAEGS